ncbi:hypothetical protein CC80DRAFT_498852 [Byssothecium circinans]|uniref:F-box domain-containing protein n=1 Tax=Byssothecium circinans TaxID=147558 RepID=A0A6A5URL5_9PLEO|nr:hypothetical protein CC80DRAFT_498852 [Byssothecium circinans]
MGLKSAKKSLKRTGNKLRCRFWSPKAAAEGSVSQIKVEEQSQISTGSQPVLNQTAHRASSARDGPTVGRAPEVGYFGAASAPLIDKVPGAPLPPQEPDNFYGVDAAGNLPGTAIATDSRPRVSAAQGQSAPSSSCRDGVPKRRSTPTSYNGLKAFLGPHAPTSPLLDGDETTTPETIVTETASTVTALKRTPTLPIANRPRYRGKLSTTPYGWDEPLAPLVRDGSKIWVSPSRSKLKHLPRGPGSPLNEAGTEAPPSKSERVKRVGSIDARMRGVRNGTPYNRSPLSVSENAPSDYEQASHYMADDAVEGSSDAQLPSTIHGGTSPLIKSPLLPTISPTQTPPRTTPEAFNHPLPRLNTAVASKPSLLSLPDEILLNIQDYVNPLDLYLNIRLVNHRFEAFAMDSLFNTVFECVPIEHQLMRFPFDERPSPHLYTFRHLDPTGEWVIMVPVPSPHHLRKRRKCGAEIDFDNCEFLKVYVTLEFRSPRDSILWCRAKADLARGDGCVAIKWREPLREFLGAVKRSNQRWDDEETGLLVGEEFEVLCFMGSLRLYATFFGLGLLVVKIILSSW